MSDAYEQSRGTLTQEERTWALAAHIGSLLAAYVALGFLAPLIVMLLKGESSPFVRRHAVESLNFQVSLLIYAFVGLVLGFFIVIGSLGVGALVVVPAAFVLAAVVLVLIVVATVRASNGEDFRYPLTLRFIR